MPEEHHAEPAAQSPTQARHPQQRALRDAAALPLRLRLVHAVKDEAQKVDEQKVKEEDFRHIVKSSNRKGLAKIKKFFFCPFLLIGKDQRIKADIKGLPHLASAPPVSAVASVPSLD